MISSDKAIEIAIVGCKTPHLVLVGEPKNIRTPLLSLDKAAKLISIGEGYANYGKSMDTKVWLVQMDGQFQFEGGPVDVTAEGNPVINPTPREPTWGTCSVIVEASSGNIILIQG